MRIRSVEDVVDEVKSLCYLGARAIQLIDDNLRLSMAAIRDLYDPLQTTFRDLRWNCDLHVSLNDARQCRGCCVLDARAS